MSTVIGIIGLILMGISVVLMLFGIGVAIVDTFWGLYQFNTMDGVKLFISGAMLLLVGLIIAGLSTASVGG